MCQSQYWYQCQCETSEKAFFTDCQLTSFKSTTTSFQVVVGCCVALGVQLFNLMMELANPQLTHTSVRWIMRLVPSFQTFPLSPPGRIIFASETFLFWSRCKKLRFEWRYLHGQIDGSDANWQKHDSWFWCLRKVCVKPGFNSAALFLEGYANVSDYFKWVTIKQDSELPLRTVDFKWAQSDFSLWKEMPSKSPTFLVDGAGSTN